MAKGSRTFTIADVFKHRALTDLSVASVAPGARSAGMSRGLMLVLGLCAAVAIALPATAEDAQKESLKEAVYLATCADLQWKDAESFKLLMEACGDSSRRAMYMWNRAMAIVPYTLITGFELPFDATSSPEEYEKRHKAFSDEYGDLANALSASDAALLACATGVRSANGAERLGAAAFLCTFSSDGEPEKERITLLIMLLNDPLADVRVAAVMWDRSSGPPTAPARRAVPFLAVRVMLDSEDSVRRYAARKLGQLVGADFGPSEEGTTEKTEAAARKWIQEHCDLSALRGEEAIRDLPPQQNPAALISLAEAYYAARCAASGWQDDKWWNLLTSTVQDDTLRAQYLLGRWEGCLTAAREEPPSIRPADWEQEHEALEHAAEQAEQALEGTGREAFLAWVTLVHAAPPPVPQQNPPWIRANTAENLGRFSDTAEGVDVLVMLLNDPDNMVRDEAALALAETSDDAPNEVARRALPFLALRALRDPWSGVRYSCVQTVIVLAGGPPDIRLRYGENEDWAQKWISEHYELSLITAH